MNNESTQEAESQDDNGSEQSVNIEEEDNDDSLFLTQDSTGLNDLLLEMRYTCQTDLEKKKCVLIFFFSSKAAEGSRNQKRGNDNVEARYFFLVSSSI